MDNKLSHFIYRDIVNDDMLNNSYQQLLLDYANSLFKKAELTIDNNYRILLNYADLLSLSKDQFHQNIAQQIVILLSLIFPKNEVN